MSNSLLGLIDIVIIVLFLLLIAIIKVKSGKSVRTGEDLFLAGRSLGWVAIGFSLFASNISSTTLIGLSGQAYSSGLSVSNYEWMAAVVLIFFVLFFIPAYYRSKVMTVPELLEKRFDRRARVYFSVLTLFANIVIDTAGTLFAGAVVFQVLIGLLFPGLAANTSLIFYGSVIVLAFVSGFTATGGFKAVAYTDIAQAVILLVGSTVLTYMVFDQIGFSWERVTAETPPEMLSIIQPLNDPDLPWLGTLIGVPVLGFYFWCTNQFIAQRFLAAKDVNNARWGGLFAGLLKLPVLLIMVLPGLMARIIFPDIENGDSVYPTMIIELLPTGLLGLVLAGLIAAIMSSLDSTLLSASTLITMDFITPRYPHLRPEQVKRIGRWAIIFFIVLSAAWTPVISHYSRLFEYLQSALAYIVPPVVAIVILGFFWKRGNGTGAFWTLVGGHVFSLTLFLLNQLGVISIHFTILAGLLLAFSSILFVVVSLLGKEPMKEKLSHFFYQKGDISLETSNHHWYKDYRYLSAGLALLTIILVVSFW